MIDRYRFTYIHIHIYTHTHRTIHVYVYIYICIYLFMSYTIYCAISPRRGTPKMGAPGMIGDSELVTRPAPRHLVQRHSGCLRGDVAAAAGPGMALSWTPKVCKMMAFWAFFLRFFAIILHTSGVQVFILNCMVVRLPRSSFKDASACLLHRVQSGGTLTWQ